MKKLILIAAALGWLERPDTDGIFLQEEEAGKLDQILADNAAAITAAGTAAVEATDKITALTTRISELEGQVTAATAGTTALNETLAAKETALATANTRIAELEAMEGKSSSTVATEDPANDTSAAEKNKKYLTVFDRMVS
jgi:chromosome segregation ATPase